MSRRADRHWDLRRGRHRTLRGIVLVAAAHTILITIIVLWRWLRG